MLVARNRYIEYDNEYYRQNMNENREKELKQKKAAQDRKIGILLTISMLICIAIISSSLILVLLRYTSISETKYNINTLNKEADSLEIQIQQLKANLDSLTRSDIVEVKAIEELNMQYPKYEQMVFIESTSNMDHIASSMKNDNPLEKQTDNRNFGDYLILSFEKIYALLD